VFHQIVEQEADNAWAHLGLGRVACARGYWAQSLPHLRQAAVSPNTQKGAWTLLANVHTRLGNDKEGARAMHKAAMLAADPEPPDQLLEALERLRVGKQAHLARASKLLKQGRAAEAVVLLRDVVRDYPDSASAWLGFGRALIGQEKYAFARQALERAVRLDPNLVEGHFYLGVALFQQGQPGAALFFRRTTKLRPDHGLAWYNLGHSLKREGDRGGAEEAFRAAVRYKPFHADAHANLGEMLIQNGKRAEAMQHLQRALTLEPTSKLARQLLENEQKKKE
jgi:tetratricopeptide (TPR) repeat protein